MPGSDPVAGSQKKALVIRLGAYGDVIMITPALRALKEAGYHVTVNVSDRAAPILAYNPHVDEVIIHDSRIPNLALGEHWAKLAVGYDRVINFSESIEKALLKIEGGREFAWPHERRHAECNVNYYDQTMRWAGFPERIGTRGELFFSPDEEAWGREVRERNQKRFVVLWSLSGSSHHKTYPFSSNVGIDFLNRHPDAVIFTVGEDLCRLLEWDHPRTKKRCGQWSIRKSLLMCREADLVVAPETGVAAGAGCFDTPKVIMLSHSSEENLTKHLVNCTAVKPEETPCHPCHQLHYTLKSCPLDTLVEIPPAQRNYAQHLDDDVVAPRCVARLKPETLLQAMERYYDAWKEQRDARTREARAA